MKSKALQAEPYFKKVAKDTLIKGEPVTIDCFEFDGQCFEISRSGPISILKLEDEWFEDLDDPSKIIEAVKSSSELRPDIFSFWQRPPDIEPKYDFYSEEIDIALLPIRSFEDWWNKGIKSRVRNLIRKSEKKGLEVKITQFDDDFVKGMTEIFNESPIRQGRKFWHYGKDEETIRRQFSRYLHREDMIGAYFEGKMIGFIMMGNAGCFGLTGQIISSIHHRDKATNNALIAKAVELCEKKDLDYLCYLFWSEDSLSEFKRRCGFQKVQLPRYYIPITSKGKLALKYGMHRGWKAMLPQKLTAKLKEIRRAWNEKSSK